jgi:uracil-DNA glycosylase
MKYLEQLLDLVPDLRVVVLIARKAQWAESRFRTRWPKLKIVNTPHPSPLFINNARDNRELILRPLQQVAQYLENPT